MKKISSFLLLLAVIVGISYTSCKKYEDGPMISLASKKARLANTWKIDQVLYNGVVQIIDPDELNSSMEITKDGKIIYAYLGTTFTYTASWAFTSDKEGLIITATSIYGSWTTTYNILKLKNKELWLEETDGADRIEAHYVPK